MLDKYNFGCIILSLNSLKHKVLKKKDLLVFPYFFLFFSLLLSLNKDIFKEIHITYETIRNFPRQILMPTVFRILYNYAYNWIICFSNRAQYSLKCIILQNSGITKIQYHSTTENNMLIVKIVHCLVAKFTYFHKKPL